MSSARISILLGPIVGFGLAAALAALTGCAGDESTGPAGPRPVKMEEVQEAKLNLEREFPGRAKALRSVDLSFRVSGQLLRLPREGENVEEGQLLAEIDPRDYETRVEAVEAQLASAEAQLKAMRTGARPEDISRLESALRAREAEFNEVKVREERYQQLLSEGVASQQEYDQVKSELDVASSNLEAAQKELEIGQAGAREEEIESQEAVVMSLEADLRQAQDSLSDARLLAPFGGQIAATYPDSFQEIQAKEPVLTLHDVSKMKVEIELSERDMAIGADEAATVQEVSETVEAIAVFTAFPDQEIPVRVLSYETVADALTQTFTITLVMDQPEGNPILPGMSATIRGTGVKRARSGSIYIPSEAVVGAPDGSKMVWVVKDGKVVRRQVTGDEIVEGRMRISDGLEPGEVIATSAVHTLTEGQQVRKMGDLREL